MKELLLFGFLLAFHFNSRAQQKDTTHTGSNFSTKLSGSGYWTIVSAKNISFKCHTPVTTEIENKIINLESLECEALRLRDTATLIRVWGKDHTLNEIPDPLFSQKNGLPYYVSLSRMIEYITPIDSTTVYASGKEVSSKITLQFQIEQPSQKKFFHIWTKKNGAWKMTTKRTY